MRDAAREHPEALEAPRLEELPLEGEPRVLRPLALGQVDRHADHAAHPPVHIVHGSQPALEGHLSGRADPGDRLAGERPREVSLGTLGVAHERGQRLREVQPHHLA